MTTLLDFVPFWQMPPAELVVFIADAIGLVAFALSGVLLAGRLQLDGFGVIVLAFLPAVGGGTVRDLLLGVTPFWMDQPGYIWGVLASVALGWFVLSQYPNSLNNAVFPLLDAIGLATFTVVGAQKALALNFRWEVAVVMGILTAVGGGLMRDVVASITPTVLKKELYATVSAVGGMCMVALLWVGVSQSWAMGIAAVLTFLYRVVAWSKGWNLPIFDLSKTE